jgi:hypothetical protein
MTDRPTEAREAAAAASRLRALYRRADAETLSAGRDWYPHARRVAADIAAEAPRGVGVATMARVIAALSPQMRWAANVHEARNMARAAARMDGDPIFGELGAYGAAYAAGLNSFPAARDLAARILAGERRAKVTGPKRGAFWRAILGDREAITVDIWAARAAGYDPDRLTPRRLRIIQRAYRLTAAWSGEAPRDLQAIVWLVARGTVGPAATAELSAIEAAA